ncbi:uncharacterized protein LOC129577999 [Sitodiplosis mosellana]|uniref:uncharacterized protein LOC129577999 n=1 Tax=Sitodiplosis mosellana TaxID=263140 RepID=UPI0024442923|nr:uncharacterized protein LOC129577999 [Sitodiplosis mosellana]
MLQASNEKRTKELQRITMALDLTMDSLKQTDHLLDATIKNIGPICSQPASSQSAAPSDSTKLTPPSRKYAKTTSSPLTNTIGDLNLGFATFVATCRSEVNKYFETNDNNKVERLRRLKKCLELVLVDLAGTDRAIG